MHNLWRDPVADRFCREFVEPWEPLIYRVLMELERLEAELTNAEAVFRE